jgi:hypothetical protein
MGKSTLLENMAIQDIQSGEGLAFIDPHGSTAEKLLEYVPEERIKDVLYFAPFDLEYPVSFNIMEDIGADKRHLVVNGLMSTFEKIWVDAWSARMAYILQNTLLALLEYPGSTLLGVNRVLSDKAYRNKVVENVKDPSVRSFWLDEFAKYTDRFAAEATPAIQNKVGQFTSNALVRNIIGQPHSSFDIRKIMDERKILIVNLSKGRVGESNANLLGSMLITKIYLAAMSRADANASELQKLPNFYLYVDEFQSFANKSFADILSEARKYKLNLTIAHQYIEQMEEEVRDAVFGNVGTMITFRVGAYDAEVLEKEFAPVFTAEDLVNLGSFQIYLKLMIDGIGSQPFSARSLPPIEKQEASHVDAIKENSRKVFARPRAVVEKDITDWHDEDRGAPPPKADKSVRSEDRNDRKEGGDRGRKPIDIRGRKPEAPGRPRFAEASRDGQSFEGKARGADDRKPEKEAKKQVIQELPSEDFTPLSAVSLNEIKKKEDNQRKPDAKKVNDLKDALKSVIGPQASKLIEKAAPSPRPSASNQEASRPAGYNATPSPAPKPSSQVNGPTPEELKKILDAA